MTKMRLNCDRLMAAAVGKQTLECVVLEANAPIKGGLDAACVEGAGEELGGTGMEKFKGSVAGLRHWRFSFSQFASDCCISSS